MSDAELHLAAERLLRQSFSDFGVGLERIPDLDLGYALLLPDGTMRVAKVLPSAGPHPRGHGASLGMHWMLRSDVEDWVALVDSVRELVWLLPAQEFRSRASPQKSGRWHLDWFVSRAKRSRWPAEQELNRYRIENVLARRLEPEQGEPVMPPRRNPPRRSRPAGA